MSSDEKSAGGPSTNKKASAQYQKLSQLEHVLKRPDTYIGSVEFHESTLWVCDEQGNLEYKEVSIVPGLYKIFDEILVNAADNKVRDSSMKNIKVNIDAPANEITVRNDGKGIPIEIHDKEKMYIPELIFGNLLTSSNYDDTEKKVTGGRNGFGAKLCNIFSTKFVLETADKKQVYRQEWHDNMTKVDPPVISKNSTGKSYTSITFYPDLAKFGMEKLDEGLLSVLRRRVYDIAGTTRGVTVNLNNQVVPISDFKAYVDLFVKALKKEGDEDAKIVYAKVSDRWEIAFSLSDGMFNQMSFVNSIATTSGGTHVNYIADQISNYVLDVMNKKNSRAGGRGGKLQKANVRANMFLFINCKIDNPSFTSQTKEQLTTKVSAFGSKCDLPDKFLKEVTNKTDLVDRLLAISERNADKELSKHDGAKKQRLTEFVKLDDASKAGTKESAKCTLILTEGDSAKSLAVAGFAEVGREYYGAFPLRGKLLNVREASQEQILKNKEIQALKKIIGLQHKKKYTSVEGLRYGHVMIMTDQDYDGSHIKGLIINFMESAFPGLLDIPGFLVEFITPIVKVSIKRGSRTAETLSFFTMPEFEHWRETTGKTCKWSQKYYKGLGTSSAVEGREYFRDIERHEKQFMHLQDGDKERIELAFSKTRADDRKQWLQEFQPGTHLDPDLKIIPIKDFIDKELILFSMADNVRSIPSVLDGLKQGQRKVMWACFLRNLVREIRVAQLTGWVSEKASYHHGEQSLNQTIVGLAQDFVGTNNIYYLLPRGGFGSRETGGKDASAPRYIHTLLNPITRMLFNSADDPLLTYLQDDEATVEPLNYVPILPTILVNGAEGIGTGWSTNIPSYNPIEIVENIRRMMNGDALKPLLPWYRGWTGTIETVPGNDTQYRVCGRIEQIDANTLAITELPVKMWTETMKEFLLKSLVGGSKGDKKLQAGEFIEDMTEEHKYGIRFIVKLSNAEMAKAKAVGLYSKFKLMVPMSIANMVAFDPLGRLRRYRSPEEILQDFYYVRLDFYGKRKDHLSSSLKNDIDKLSAQARFIQMIVDNELIVSRKPKKVLVEELKELRFPLVGPDGFVVFPEELMDVVESEEAEDDVEEEEAAAQQGEMAAQEVEDGPSAVKKPKAPSYDYLLSMQILSLTRERYEKLLQQRGAKEDELNELLSKTTKDLWNEDLDKFVEQWYKFEKHDAEAREGTGNKKPNARKRKVKDEDDDDFGAPKKRKAAKSKKAALSDLASLPSVAVPLPPVADFGSKSTRVKKEPSSTAATPAPETGPTPASESEDDKSKVLKDAKAADKPAAAKAKAAPKAAPKAAAKTATKAAAKPAATRAKKASAVVKEESDDSDFEIIDAEAPKRAPRARRATPVKSMVESSDSEMSAGDDADESVFVLSD